MKIGIVSDVHGNAEAFQVVLNEIKDVDQIYCLGDIVGYGADPEYCIERINSMMIPTIKGNHEGALTGELDLRYFNVAARKAILWTRKHLQDKYYNYLKNLKKKIVILKDILGVHGSPRQPLWEYILNEQTAQDIFESFDFKIYFIGHSHIAGYFTFHRKNKLVHYYSASSEVEFKIKGNNSYIINCGSVGQPRDGNPKASFAIFDTDSFSVRILRKSYPVEKAQEKIIKAGLPRFLSDRLSMGI